MQKFQAAELIFDMSNIIMPISAAIPWLKYCWMHFLNLKFNVKYALESICHTSNLRFCSNGLISWLMVDSGLIYTESTTPSWAGPCTSHSTSSTGSCLSDTLVWGPTLMGLRTRAGIIGMGGVQGGIGIFAHSFWKTHIIFAVKSQFYNGKVLFITISVQGYSYPGIPSKTPECDTWVHITVILGQRRALHMMI